jgi:NAD(P)-dependent dehydrogenase (short-subunit alcohol dehydrogenase family)
VEIDFLAVSGGFPPKSVAANVMKTFLSIGSGPGMGLATAERFAKEAFEIVLSARNTDKTQALAEQLRAKGHKVTVRKVYASDPRSIASLIAKVEKQFGAIDVLHYNAASIRKATILEQPRDTFNADLAINVGGALVAAQALIPKMSERGSGTILLTGCALALEPNSEYLSLSIGKAGIRALAHGLFESLKEKGIHVATVTVSALVSPGSKDAEAVAEHFWQLHNQRRGSWTPEMRYGRRSL